MNLLFVTFSSSDEFRVATPDEATGKEVCIKLTFILK